MNQCYVSIRRIYMIIINWSVLDQHIKIHDGHITSSSELKPICRAISCKFPPADPPQAPPVSDELPPAPPEQPASPELPEGPPLPEGWGSLSQGLGESQSQGMELMLFLFASSCCFCSIDSTVRTARDKYQPLWYRMLMKP